MCACFSDCHFDVAVGTAIYYKQAKEQLYTCLLLSNIVLLAAVMFAHQSRVKCAACTDLSYCLVGFLTIADTAASSLVSWWPEIHNQQDCN